MTAAFTPPLTEMEIKEIINFVRRAYKQTKSFQWVREAGINSLEANATRILFDVCLAWYAKHGDLVLDIADDGIGVSRDQVRPFFNTFGGGGKPIGDEHENMGIGFKISVLPWSNEVLVRSLKDGKFIVFKMRYFDDTGKVGLEHLPLWGDALRPDDADPEDEIEFHEILETDASVLDTASWEYLGVDWIQSFPQWIKDAGHGTVITLLGTDTYRDTFYGDPNRAEEHQSRWATMDYVDRRFLDFPAGVTVQIGTADAKPADRHKVTAALDKIIKRTQADVDAEATPIDEDEYDDKKVKHWERRKAKGLLAAIHYLPKKAWTVNGLDHKVDPADPTWIQTATFDIGAANLPATASIFYKNVPGLEQKDYGWVPSRAGLVAAVYQAAGTPVAETYDLDRTGARHQTCGIYFQEVYSKTWLLIEPTLHDATEDSGVYPGQSRDRLFWKNSMSDSNDLPWEEWGAEIESRLAVEAPFVHQAILDAMGNNSADGADVSKGVLKRVAGQFFGRFKPYKPPKAKKHQDPKNPADIGEPGQGEDTTGTVAPEPALIEGNGTTPMTEVGNPSKSGDNSTPKNPATEKWCDHCQRMISVVSPHDDGCPNKPKDPRAKGFEDPEGDIEGGPSKSKRNAFSPDKQGTEKGRGPAADDDTLIPFVWVSFNDVHADKVTRYGPDLSCVYVKTIEADGTVREVVQCNRDHPVYLETVATTQKEWGNKAAFNSPCKLAVEEVLGTSASSTVTQLVQQKLPDQVMRERLSEDGLANTFYGLYDHYDHIMAEVKRLVGPGVKRARRGSGSVVSLEAAS